MPQEPKPNRRWFQISLRTLMLLVTAACVGFGWFSYRMRKAERQVVAVKAVRLARGWVVYDYDWEKDGSAKDVPAWLRTKLGDDFFTTVTNVRVYGPAFTDSELAQLEGLPRLEGLGLWGTQVSDAGLVHLEQMTLLKELDLNSTQITDAGLAHLRRLTRLEQLDLYHTQVTDTGCKELQVALPNLKIRR